MGVHDAIWSVGGRFPDTPWMLNAGKAVFLCALALLSIGVVMVHSAGLVVDGDDPVTFRSIVLSRSSVYMVLAVVAMAGAATLPIGELARPTRLSRWTPALIPILALALALVYVEPIGHNVNGASRWLRVPGTSFTFQPSELAKWGLVLVTAWYARKFASRLPRFFAGLAPILIIVGGMTAFIALEDLGTAFLIASVCAIMLIAAGARVWHFAALSPVGLSALAAFVLTSEYRTQRLLSFVNPYADPDGTGYHIIQSMVAIANGDLTGRGLGFGLQKFGYLPEDQTDFLFSIIAEELGVAGAALIMAIYVILLLASVNIARRQTDAMLRFAALGVSLMVSFQACINLLVVTGLMPTKGIALPLLSSGGTGWVLTAASLGLLIAMDRHASHETSEAREPIRTIEPAEEARAAPSLAA